ncbi:MAG: hypothetical protein H6836_05695 [Planctomycetes bacterium]|nr:hypothetical protein [Planctomycetota bacterium]MCB9889051.1 hypothetical protein [Planctomycetota bacterium]
MIRILTPQRGRGNPLLRAAAAVVAASPESPALARSIHPSAWVILLAGIALLAVARLFVRLRLQRKGRPQVRLPASPRPATGNSVE